MTSALRNIGKESIFFVTFQTNVALTAQADAGGAIYIDFPTGTTSSAIFATDLGTSKSTGDEIPCKNAPIATAPAMTALPLKAGKQLKCFLIESKYTEGTVRQPASIKIVNFDTLATDVRYRIAIAQIKNPAAAVTDCMIGIRLYENAVQKHYDQFHFFVDA